MAKGTLTLGALGLGLMVGSLGLPGVSPAPAWGQVDCGDTIGPGGIVFLTANVGPCATDPALTVVGPVIFNLNGFTVSCETTATDGIVIEGTGAIVSNGTVRDCQDGVAVEGDGRHVITRITSRDNGRDGFVIPNDWNTLAHNQADDNDRLGFHIDGNHNNFSFNRARRNTRDGFQVDGGGQQHVHRQHGRG